MAAPVQFAARQNDGIPPPTRSSASRPTARAARLAASKQERLLAGLGAAGCLVVLGLAAWLHPSPNGHGTHEQMGLPACGWVAAFGKPCPTCGMTTAFAAAAHRDALGAVRAQPMGAALALVTATGFWANLHQMAFGSRIWAICGKLLRPRVLWTVASLWALAWAYKMVTWTGS